MPYFDDAEDMVSGECIGFRSMNAAKNHWRGSTPPAGITPGALFSDADDDKLYHATGPSGAVLEEVLQETMSSDRTPLFHALKLYQHAFDVADPPTDANLDAALGTTPAGAGAGFLALVKDTTSGGKLYLVGSDGTHWWTLTFALAT